jgi:hypothetical protein
MKIDNPDKKKLIMQFIALLAIYLFANGCKPDNEISFDRYFRAEIVGFDMNCYTCKLKFPNDSIEISNAIGASRNGYYQTINLMKDTFKIGQKISVKLRKAEDSDLRACITFYPSSVLTKIYILDFKTK